MAMTEAAATLSWRAVAAMLLLLVGLVCIALSVVWPAVSTGRSAWSDEQALAYQAASAEVHRLSMQAAATEPEKQTRALHDELNKAEAKYRDLRAELDSARSRPSRIAKMLRIGGILLLAGGIVGLIAKRDGGSRPS
jgi:hypothetical protein